MSCDEIYETSYVSRTVGLPGFMSKIVGSCKVHTKRISKRGVLKLKFGYSEKATKIWPIFHFLFDINW